MCSKLANFSAFLPHKDIKGKMPQRKDSWVLPMLS